MTDVSELVVPGITPGWQLYSGESTEYIAQVSAGHIAAIQSEIIAIQKAAAQVALAAGSDLNDPRTQDLYDAALERFKHIRYIAEWFTTFDPFRAIALLPDGSSLTGPQVTYYMDRISFEMTTDFTMINGAQTFPSNPFDPSSSDFTIRVNPNHTNVIDIIDDVLFGHN